MNDWRKKMIESLVISLVLTVVIEVILSLIIGLRGEDNIETVIWVNCITNPILVFITNSVYFLSNSILIRNIVLVILEIIVVFWEGKLFENNLKDFKIKPYIFSLYLNGLSFGIGLVINYILR